MRIAFIFYNLGIGGVQRKIVDIVNYIEDHGLSRDVEIDLLLDREEEFNYRQDIRNQHVNIVYKSQWWKSGFLKHGDMIPFAGFIAYALLTRDYHSVLSFQPMPSVYAAVLRRMLWFKKFKLVISEDNITDKWIEYSFDRYDHWRMRIKNWVKKRLTGPMVRLSYPWADRVVCMTHYCMSGLHDHYGVPGSRMTVIYNWTDVSPHSRKKKRYDIIYFGRFGKQKKVHKVVKIVRKVADQKKDVSVLMIGDGRDKPRILKMIKTLKLENHITVMPSVHHVKDYVKESKVFVLTSDLEGYPLALLEAQACGLVPVVLAYPGVKEHVIDGKTGFVEKNIAAMAQRVLEVLEDSTLYSQVSRQAYKYVCTSHTKDNIEKYLEALDIV